MSCDDFLPFLETGGPLRRMQARRHAARCPRCAALHVKFIAIKEQLAHPDARSLRSRELWRRAASDTLVQPGWRHPWVPAVVALATAACVLIAVLRPVVRDGDPRLGVIVDSSVVRVVGPTTVVEVDPTGELSELAAAARRLDDELKALRDLAERLEAEREVAMTLTRYGKW